MLQKHVANVHNIFLKIMTLYTLHSELWNRNYGKGCIIQPKNLRMEVVEGLLEAHRQGKSDDIKKPIWDLGPNFLIWVWWSQHPEFAFSRVG